jgi:hypothetical protein
MKIRAVGVELFRAGGWTDGQTDMTKLIVALCNVVNPPKNGVSVELLLISIKAVMSCVVVKRRKE